MDTAVLFLVFNRPDTTQKVFEAIRDAKPSRLYVAGDGPRDSRPTDIELVKRTRDVLLAVDWPCSVLTLFQEKNLGCKYAVSQAIDWFFAHEEEGIVLEDDCLPHPDFFDYCETLLDRYRDNPKVMAISGNSFRSRPHLNGESYFFSKYNHVWGWASWRRAWSHYDVELSNWHKWKRSLEWLEALDSVAERHYWSRIFTLVSDGLIDTWDYQWTASIWKNGGLSITPSRNLVSNIGFGNNATHTKDSRSERANQTTFAIQSLVHPVELKRDVEADKELFLKHFNGRYLSFPYSLMTVPYLKVRDLVKRMRSSS